MKRIAIAAALAITATSVQAGPFSSAEIQMVGGSAIFELWMDDAMLPECRGANAAALTVSLKTKNGTTPYGTGCWIAGMDGYIQILTKGFKENELSERRIHNSEFKPVEQPIPEDIKEMMTRADILDVFCTASTATKWPHACAHLYEHMEQLEALGYCWGPEGAADAEKHWLRCEAF